MVTFLQSTVSVFYKYFITTSIYGMFERPPFPNHFILFFFSWKRPFLVRYFITGAWSHGPNSLSAVIVYSIESLKNCFDGDKNRENCKNIEKMEDYPLFIYKYIIFFDNVNFKTRWSGPILKNGKRKRKINFTKRFPR